MAKAWTKEKYDKLDPQGGMLLAEELIANIRPQDAMDLVASGGDIVFEVCACLQQAEESYVYRGEHDELLVIMGISRYSPEAAGRAIYMLGTAAVNDISYVKQLLVAEARSVISGWLKQYGMLFNAVNVKNEKSQRWLTRLGARWLPEEIKVGENRFRQFVIIGGE